MFVYGMTGKRANCFILVGSFWLIAGRYILYMLWESLYILLTIIMPLSLVVLLLWWIEMCAGQNL